MTAQAAAFRSCHAAKASARGARIAPSRRSISMPSRCGRCRCARGLSQRADQPGIPAALFERQAERHCRLLLSRRQGLDRRSTCCSIRPATCSACPSSTPIPPAMCAPTRHPFYGDFTYDFTDQLSLRSAAATPGTSASPTSSSRPRSAAPRRSSAATRLLFATADRFPRHGRCSSASPRAPRSASSQRRTIMFYATYSEGFKGGGFDPRGSAARRRPDTNHDGVRDLSGNLQFPRCSSRKR